MYLILSLVRHQSSTFNRYHLEIISSESFYYDSLTYLLYLCFISLLYFSFGHSQNCNSMVVFLDWHYMLQVSFCIKLWSKVGTFNFLILVHLEKNTPKM